MIKPLGIFSPSFKQKYINHNGITVNVDEEAIKQAKRQMQIRKTVEESIKQSDDQSVKYGDVYFTIFSDGSCKLSENKICPIWHVKAHGVDVKREGWISSEIDAEKTLLSFIESSDEGGSVRAYGNGNKFAVIYPDGDIYIRKIAEEIFPEKNS